MANHPDTPWHRQVDGRRRRAFAVTIRGMAPAYVDEEKAAETA